MYVSTKTQAGRRFHSGVFKVKDVYEQCGVVSRDRGAREAGARRGRGGVPAGDGRAGGRGGVRGGVHARLLGRGPRAAPRLPHRAHQAQEDEVRQVSTL